VLPVALALVLGAAGMHATWNVLLKAAPDPLRLAQRAMFIGAAAFAPVTLVAWLAAGRPGLPPAAWLLATASALFELAYFVFLSRAYRLGELSFVYPIARGTGPLVAVAGGLLLLRERVSSLQLLGIAALLAGIWLVRRPSGARGPLAAAIATGVCIGAYTVIDRAGVQLGPAWLYAWVVFAATAAALAGWVALRPAAAELPAWPRSALVGVLMTSTYYAVLMALALAPVTLIAPARESAIVLVSAWSVLRLGEREGVAFKLAGAAAIVVGIVLLVVPA
jgi:drug/metabolite transporter (DMT)-like permease